MPTSKLKTTIATLIANVTGYIFAYYVAILLHEFGHGTMAWLYGLKKRRLIFIMVAGFCCMWMKA